MQAQDIPQRKYALTKVKPGDYLLPSNDGQTLWRFAKYEDGPSSGLTDWPRDREVWGAFRWTGTIESGEYADTGDWEQWEMIGGPYESRKDAIDDALLGVIGG